MFQSNTWVNNQLIEPFMFIHALGVIQHVCTLIEIAFDTMHYFIIRPVFLARPVIRTISCLSPTNGHVSNRCTGLRTGLIPSCYTTIQRHISARPPPPPEKKGFFHSIIDNIRQEISRNKELKENLQHFRKEAAKLEESEALKKAREKYDIINQETSKGSQQLKESMDTIKQAVNKTLEDVQQSEIGKKGIEVTEGITKQAKAAADVIAKSGEKLADAQAIKTIGKGVQAVSEEVNIGSGLYRRPEVLRKRKELSEFKDEREIKPNEQVMGVELHKDSKWSQSWTSFRDNNPYVNKFFDWKMKYDESDNPMVRVTRLVTDKITDVFGSLFTKTELSEVLTEIVKMDPTFDKVNFMKELEQDIIPNVLEAMVRGDLEILADWCHEAAYNVISTPIKKVIQLGHRMESKILDLNNVDIVMGKMMDQGPVLVITFQTQQIDSIVDVKGNVVDGDPDKIILCNYVWVLCRDQTELDPKAAWKILEMAASSTPQFL